MPGTAQHRSFEGSVVQGRALVWAAIFHEDRLSINDDQQQMTTLHLKSAAIAFVQIDQSFQRYEHGASDALGFCAYLHMPQ